MCCPSCESERVAIHPLRRENKLITTEVALEWGRLNVLRPLPAVDSMLAATANVHGLVLATRNVGDLVNVGVSVVNPFDYEES